MSRTVPRVLISQFGVLPHFRVRFFQMLEQMRPPDWDFAVVSDSSPETGSAVGYTEQIADAGALGFPVVLVRSRRLGPGGNILWQGAPPFGQDRVRAFITDSKLSNLTYAMAPFVGAVRGINWGVWGHVRDLQATVKPSWKKRTAEMVKGLWLARCRHFFAYSQSEALEANRRLGLPEARITVLNNTIDVAGEIAAASRQDVAGGRDGARAALRLPAGAPVYLTVGRLSPERRLERMAPVARELLSREPDAVWVVIGDGPGRAALEAVAEEFPGRFRLEGAITRGDLLALWYAAADLYVLFGCVGLGVVQAFAHGLPAVVWQGEPHGPEIHYCNDGNSLQIPAESQPTVQAQYIQKARREVFSAREPSQIQDSVRHLTLDAMAQNLVEGIERLLL